MPQSGELFAKRIAAHLGGRVRGAHEIVGLGAVNHVVVTETNLGKWVIRFSVDPLDKDDYAKEEWCLKAAADSGIPSPEFISRGQLEEKHFIVQSFVEGVHGDLVRSAELWVRLGCYAKTIAQIPLATAPDSLFPRFGRNPLLNWHLHVAYNIRQLHASDPLIALRVYEHKDQDKIRAIFHWIYYEISDFGLSHGDVVPKNVIIPPKGDPVLLDWGSASVSPTPQEAILRVRTGTANEGYTESDLLAFASGHGADMALMQRSLDALLLLNRIDLVRWAIDNRRDRILDTVEAAKSAVRSMIG